MLGPSVALRASIHGLVNLQINSPKFSCYMFTRYFKKNFLRLEASLAMLVLSSLFEFNPSFATQFCTKLRKNGFARLV